MIVTKRILSLLAVAYGLILLLTVSSSFAQRTISYQGVIENNGVPLSNGPHTIAINIYKSATGGIAVFQETQSVTVTNGLFDVLIGKVNSLPTLSFIGTPYYLGIQVDGSAELTPRSQLADVPSAFFADTANFARNVGSGSGINGVGTNGTVPLWTGATTESNSKLTDNGTTLSYSGTNINTTTAYQIGGSTMVSVGNGGRNTFLGYGAGQNTTSTGNRNNTFTGYQAGQANTGGFFNTYTGGNAGQGSTAAWNTFTGANAGQNNVTGGSNTFTGGAAGQFSNTGSGNTFTGWAAGDGSGSANNTGSSNTFTGYAAGISNTTGFSNAFTGSEAGYSNTTGNYNAFVGDSAGFSNTTGGSNTFMGTFAGQDNTTANGNTFLGYLAGQLNSTGGANTFTGYEAGQNTTGGTNTFMGNVAGKTNTTGTNNTAIGNSADMGSGALTNATAIGNGAVAGASNTIQLGNVTVTQVVTVGSFNSTGGDLRTNSVTRIDNSGNATLGATTASSLNSTPIGATTPSTGAFTALTTNVITTAAASYTCSATDFTVVETNGNANVFLPAPARGRIIAIVDAASAGRLSIWGNGAGTIPINGYGVVFLYPASTNVENAISYNTPSCMTVVCDGTNWWIIGQG